MKILYTPSEQSPNAPVFVILHGYRGDAINGASGPKFAETLQDNGFATMQLNHAGYDHYGCEEAPVRLDTATLGSNVKDFSLLLDNIGDQRDIHVLANSASINIAMSDLRPNISRIYAVSPFPDFIPFISDIITSVDQGIKSAFKEHGFIHYNHIRSMFGGISPSFKLSTGFVEEGLEHPSLDEMISAAGHKPEVIVMRSRDDFMLPPNRVDNMISSLRENGFDSRDMVFQGDRHVPTPEIYEAFDFEAKFVNRGYG